MGGLGSGRHFHMGAALTIDDMLCIDVRRWAKKGFLSQPCTFDWIWKRRGQPFASIGAEFDSGRVTLGYQVRARDGSTTRQSYPVHIAYTACNLGGQRPWFICPAQGCGRRVALLYGGSFFARRHCQRLAYPSQRESLTDRATRKADRIRSRLGWTPGILNGPEPTRPKGMHWRTYQRLRQQHDKSVQIAIASAMARFGKDPLFKSLIDDL